MKTIKLPGYRDLRVQFAYDEETGVLQYRSLSTKKRRASEEAGHIYHQGPGCHYRVVQVEQPIGPSVQVYAHRVIWKLMTGEEPPEAIDHLDGDGLNNRWGNLRDGSDGENAHNMAMTSRNTSGYNGVWYDKRRQKWVVTLYKDGKQHEVCRLDDRHKAGKMARELRIREGYTERHGKRS